MDYTEAWGNFGVNEYIHCLDWGNDFTGEQICQNSSSYAI